MRNNLIFKSVVALSIALSPMVVMKSCKDFNYRLTLASQKDITEKRKEIRRQLDCLKLNK